jgi:hypothetical protein
MIIIIKKAGEERYKRRDKQKARLDSHVMIAGK